jgi:succinoglycan biosynthesis transport protein ExoP
LNESHSSGTSLAESLGGWQLRDYIDIARRRKWWVIISATAVFVTTTVAVLRTPDVYRSETVIIVDPQKVSDSVVQPTVNSNVSDRLTTIRQLANSPTRLQLIIDKLNLYPELRRQGASDAAIARMQRNISVEVIDAGGQRTSSFRIAFSSRTPVQAAAVANELGSMIIRDNLRVREQAFSGAKDFLDSQLQETKRQLEEKENEVQRIKAQYVMDLPESKQFHLEALNSLRNQTRASQDRVNQDKQEIVYLQSTLNNAAPPTVDLDVTNTRLNSPYQATIQKEEAHLSELQARYGPQYPDVRKVQNLITDLKAKAAQEAKDQPPQEQEDPAKIAQRARHNNPVVQAQIAKLDQEIEEETRRQAAMDPEIALHLSKLEHEPIFEQQISGLMRDYDTLRALYNRLLDKKLSAQMALELENSQQGEKFVILDQAPVPQAPAGPNRPLFITAGLIGGLLGGLMLALLVEMTDESVRSEREAAEILGKAVLAGVPLILAPDEKFKKWFRVAGALAGTAFVAGLIGLLLPFVFKVTA